MILHRAFVKGNPVYIQMALGYNPPIDRKRGAQKRVPGVHKIKGRVGNGADIPTGRGVKSRTIFYIVVGYSLLLQPGESLQGVLDSRFSFLGSVLRAMTRAWAGLSGGRGIVGIH